MTNETECKGTLEFTCDPKAKKTYNPKAGEVYSPATGKSTGEVHQYKEESEGDAELMYSVFAGIEEIAERTGIPYEAVNDLFNLFMRSCYNVGIEDEELYQLATQGIKYILSLNKMPSTALELSRQIFYVLQDYLSSGVLGNDK